MFVVWERPRTSLDFVDEPMRKQQSHWPRAVQTSKAASTNAEVVWLGGSDKYLDSCWLTKFLFHPPAFLYFLPALIFPPSSPFATMLSSPPQPPTRKRARPRGLWRGRVNPPRCFADHVREWQQGVYSDSDTDDDERDVPESNSSSSSKRRRLSPSSSASDDSDQRDTDFCRQYTTACTSDDVDRISSWVRRTRIMDTTSTARRGAQTDTNRSCTYEDWVDLKDLFSKAAEQYESA